MVGSTLLPGRVLFPTVLSDGSPHSRRQGPHIQEHTTNALEEVHRTAPEFPLCGSFPSRTLSYQPASLVSQRSVPLSHFTHLSEFPFPVQWQEAGETQLPTSDLHFSGITHPLLHLLWCIRSQWISPKRKSGTSCCILSGTRSSALSLHRRLIIHLTEAASWTPGSLTHLSASLQLQPHGFVSHSNQWSWLLINSPKCWCTPFHGHLSFQQPLYTR